MFKRNSFTLIELLVVLGVIGILVSILLPSLRKARKVAKIAVCHSNLKQHSVALATYMSNGNNRFPIDTSLNDQQMYYYSGKRGTYHITKSVDSDRKFLNKYMGYNEPGLDVPVAKCPLDENKIDRLNETVYDFLGSSYQAGTRPEAWCPDLMDWSKKSTLSLAEVINPSKMGVLFAFGAWHKSAAPMWYSNDMTIHGRKGFEFLFVDGHVTDKQIPSAGYGLNHSFNDLSFVNK